MSAQADNSKHSRPTIRWFSQPTSLQSPSHQAIIQSTNQSTNQDANPINEIQTTDNASSTSKAEDIDNAEIKGTSRHEDGQMISTSYVYTNSVWTACAGPTKILSCNIKVDASDKRIKQYPCC